MSEERLATLSDLGADLVVDVTPQPFDFVVVPAMYEAMVAATLPPDAELTTDDLAQFIQDAELEPRLLWPHGHRRKSRFAFVIHPLSTEYFKNVEPLGLLTNIPGMTQVVEKTVAYIPPFVYSHVTGIVSDTGDEAEGWLITVGGTPKEMLAHPPEFTYSRLLEAAELSRRLGAQIMGLGAFTKVVGDAGVTVAKQATLPVTTGNSYSASGALWAAAEAVRRLGIAEVDDDGVMHGKAMVVGASGAIGVGLRPPAGARLRRVVARVARDRQAAPDQGGDRRDDPRAVVHVATNPSSALPDVDLIVTATSAAGHEGARHHAGQARLRHHRRRPPAGHVRRGRRQAPRRARHRVRRGRAARRGPDEGHRPARPRRLRLPRRDDRARPRGSLRELHRRSQHRAGRRSRRSTSSGSSTA